MADRGRKGGPKPPTRTCFIGNLPWDIAEPQLRELFAEVGPIKTFRVVTDRETGRPKGFGFCEYFDIPTAASAQRNLNGHEINGRKIHVDFAEDKERGDGSRGPRGGPPRHQGTMGMDSAQRAAGAMVTLVDGGPPTTGVPPDGITTTLAGMSKAQLYEILAQMKGLIQQNPAQARQILVTSPQLAKALFQAQVMLGMVPMPASAAEAAQMNGPVAQQPQYDPPYDTQPPPAAGAYQQGAGLGPGPYDGGAPPQQQSYGSAPMQTDYGYAGGDSYSGTPQYDSSAPDYVPPAGYEAPPAAYVQPAYGGGSDPRQDAYAADPRQHAAAADPRAQQYPQQPYSPPPQPVAAVEQQAPPAQQPVAQQQLDSEQQKVLLAQIMNLTPAQIELLPEQQKQQVIALQAQMRQQGGGGV